MGLPSQGPESLYRNPMSEVKRLFRQQHYDHVHQVPRYKVYNLCSETVYSSRHFDNSVARFPFDDHQVAPLEQILGFCQDCAAWLAAHPDNVVAVHCKAGKGRSGLMICSLLIYLGICLTPEEALQLFSRNRTANNMGVTIPSQIRYVHYMGTAITSFRCRIPDPRSVLLERLEVTGIPACATSEDYSVVIWIRYADEAPSIAILKPEADGGEVCGRGPPSAAVLTARSGAWLPVSVAESASVTCAAALPPRSCGVRKGKAGSMHLSPVRRPAASARTLSMDGAFGLGAERWERWQQTQAKRLAKRSPQGVTFLPCRRSTAANTRHPEEGSHVHAWHSFDPLLVMQGNVKVQLLRHVAGRQEPIAWAWFNTGFLPEQPRLHFADGSLDKQRIRPLSITVEFSDCEVQVPQPVPAHIQPRGPAAGSREALSTEAQRLSLRQSLGQLLSPLQSFSRPRERGGGKAAAVPPARRPHALEVAGPGEHKGWAQADSAASDPCGSAAGAEQMPLEKRESLGIFSGDIWWMKSLARI